MRAVLVLIGLVFYVAVALASSGQTIFNANCEGQFLLPCTGNEYYAPNNPQDYCRVNPSYQAQTVTIGWGRGAAPSYQASSLEFVGYDSIPFTNSAETYYKIGQLNHFNFPIICQPPCDANIPTNFGFILYITLNIQLSAGGNYQTQFNGQYNMYLDETPNQDLRGATYAKGTICPVQGTTEDSWNRYNGGWPGAEGSNAVCCQYYTAVATQGPNGYYIGGFCSDRITFTNFESPSTFLFQNELYTLLIQGFSIDPNTISTDTSINYFTSQEYQEQIGYIWASLTKTCTSDASCNDNNQCTTDLCVKSTGTCTNTPVTTGDSCTQGPSYDYYYPNAECQQWTCNAGGSCMPSPIHNGHACTNPYDPQDGPATDCYGPVCVTGVCKYSPINTGNACNDITAGECQTTVCNAGTCMLEINPATQGKSCAVSGTSGTYISNEPQCNTARCSTNGNPQGTCSVSLSNSNTACITLPIPPICNVERCKTKQVSGVTVGTCTYTLNSGDTTCSSKSAPTCQVYSCVNGAGLSGSCSLGPVNSGVTCSGTAPVCNKLQCNGAGSCAPVYDNNNGNACTSKSSAVCTQYQCQNSGGVGTCALVNSNNGVTCSGTAPVCNQLECNGQGSCISVWDGNNNAACTSKTTKQVCFQYECVQDSQTNTGSCSLVASGTNVGCAGTPAVCNSLQCNGAGSCTNQYNGNNNAACIDKSPPACQQYGCQNSKGVGQCILENLNEGVSCAGTAPTCNVLQCNGVGTCAPVYQSGSCKGIGAAQSCQSRSCVQGQQALGVTPGTCSYIPVNGGSCQSITSKQCNQRLCFTGSCGYQASYSGQTCTSGTPSACTQLQCHGGNCVNVGYTGSCSSIAQPSSVCAMRQCNGQVPGACVYAFSGFSGSCANPSEVSDGCTYTKCVSRSNVGGSCSIESVIGGVCTLSGSFSTNDPKCWSPTCIARTTPNTGGTCTVSFATGASCSAFNNKPCNSQQCNSAGNCEFVAFQAGVTCNTGSGTASFCNPQQCNNNGQCVFNPLTGPACNSISYDDPYATANCLVSQCVAGSCQDVTNVTAYKNIVVCQSLQEGQSQCTENVCEYNAPKSPDNKQGTCANKLVPSLLNLPCVPAGPTESLADQRCWTASCAKNGTCVKANVAPNTFCDVPNNETFGCAQYNCKSGTCNYNKKVPLLNNTACTGAVICDPSVSSCNSECEQFRCINGECILYEFNEGNVCIYLKQLTARDSENPGGPSSECTVGKCQGGVCLPAVVANGTYCGNRTLYNNSCYGDYCNQDGYCINTGLKDCSGQVPLPSICWSAVCNPSNGDCELESNGVIDCSCIDNCAICTAESEAAANDTSGRTLSCYWCNGVGSNNTNQGCYDRRLPGTKKIIAAPTNAGTCFNSSTGCNTPGGGLTGGDIAGIVVGVVGFAGAALALLAIAALLARWAAASGTPPADALLQDLDFNSNVNENVFFQPLGSSGENVMYEHATATFITN